MDLALVLMKLLPPTIENIRKRKVSWLLAEFQLVRRRNLKFSSHHFFLIFLLIRKHKKNPFKRRITGTLDHMNLVLNKISNKEEVHLNTRA
jgi:hypothetical protein